MQALTLGDASSRVLNSRAKRLRIRETHTGISITEESKDWKGSAELTEAAFKLVGILLLPAGGITMYLPNIVAGQTSLVASICMLSAFVFLGVSIHRWADKGFAQKIHINPALREVTIGTQNSQKRFHKRKAYPPEAIESFFIARSKSAHTAAKLKIRLASGGQSFSVLEGPEETLIPILERISQLMQPPSKRHQRVRTKANGDFIRVDFA